MIAVHPQLYKPLEGWGTNWITDLGRGGINNFKMIWFWVPGNGGTRRISGGCHTWEAAVGGVIGSDAAGMEGHLGSTGLWSGWTKWLHAGPWSVPVTKE